MNNRLSTTDEAPKASREGLPPSDAGVDPQPPESSCSHDVPMTRLQRAVARRMTAAKAEIADFVTEVEIDMLAVAQTATTQERRRLRPLLQRLCDQGLRSRPAASPDS